MKRALSILLTITLLLALNATGGCSYVQVSQVADGNGAVSDGHAVDAASAAAADEPLAVVLPHGFDGEPTQEMRRSGVAGLRRVTDTGEEDMWAVKLTPEADAEIAAEQLKTLPEIVEVGKPGDAIIPKTDLALKYHTPTITDYFPEESETPEEPANPEEPEEPASPEEPENPDEPDIPSISVSTDEIKIKDEDNNLLVPFDVAYPAVVAAGDAPHAAGHLLLKLASPALTWEIRACGVQTLTEFLRTERGVWYKAALAEGTDIDAAIQQLRSLSCVDTADYDYIYETEAIPEDTGSVTFQNTDTDVSALIEDVCSNPLAGSQWHLTACDLQHTWRLLKANGMEPGGSSSVVVAVIDTGVDYTHPDLATSMWVNRGEIPGNGIDDDSNGYVDDIHGVDVIANTGDPQDDHGHGTHVAGIIGAANNRTGVVGVAYNCKIMAVKAGQATGVFNQSDIAEAIQYAWRNGADVINMSFGGTAISVAVQDALTAAYTTATLVAAAGNNGFPNDWGADHYDFPLPSYPGALSYVVGVMSIGVTGVESYFTNWDVKAFDSLEYEVYAPGEGILSTLPGGKYGALSGTSMASPVVAGIAALLRSWFTDRDMFPSKFIAAQLCATSGFTAYCCNPSQHSVFGGYMHNLPKIVNAYTAFTELPSPDVRVYEGFITDNADGTVDAGDELEIGLVVRNRWGMAKDTVAVIDAITGIEGLGMTNPYVEILTDRVDFGEVGTYSTKSMLIRDNDQVITGIAVPFRVKIKKECPNDYYIQLNVTITCRNGLDEDDSNTYSSEGMITFAVRNGLIKTGQITADEVWTKDNFYIIPSSLYIAEGATVTVEPGTRIQFWSNDATDAYANVAIAQLNVAGSFITQGTVEEPVEIFPSDLMDQYIVEIIQTATGHVKLNYTSVINPSLTVNTADHCYFSQVYRDYTYNHYPVMKREISASGIQMWQTECHLYGEKYTNSVFYKMGGPTSLPHLEAQLFDTCSFVDTVNNTYRLIDSGFINCSFIGNYHYSDYYRNYASFSNVMRMCVIKSWSSYNFSAGDKTYVHIYSDGWNNQNVVYASQLARSLAQYWGGDIACFETEEEYDLLKNQAIDGYVGLVRGSDTWINGEPVGDWVYAKAGGGNNYFLCKNNNDRLSFDISKNGFILELPYDGTDWDEEKVTLEIEKFTTWNQTQPNPLFSNNAILNNFNDMDASHWFRPMGDSRGNGYPTTASIASNYWGTVNEELIERQIVDFDDYSTLVDLNPYPYLTTPPENVWPFVADAYLLDSHGQRVQTVGNEMVTFVVEFNRDMDTAMLPRVRFGSSEPYAEYEIPGAFVTPRRWEGTYTLKTTIENGRQFFNISGGRAADDYWMVLYDSPGRLGFEIDTTAAQAMLMSGEATETGVRLNWVQDDFETLAGYNVYRSTKEDGYYTRLNRVVLPPDETTFFDDTAEPGVLYYYNFTVVQTDLTESTPSGKITIRAVDTMAPNIYHTPVRTAYTGTNLVISATVTDNLNVTQVKLYYRTVGEEAWAVTEMGNLNSRYVGIVPAEALTSAGLEYYIEAFDGVNYTYKGTPDEPFPVTVQAAVDATALGDVDGDGVITNRDALMILQAVNDLLNLTEEQFMRADLNGDGELSAAEALRILQYVSGKVTTIVG